MTNKKSGFTLMEIMVVIIVIAVLASVAGPMIGSITDQGRTSATKSKLSALKSALLAYQSDIGRLPFNGEPKNATCATAYCQDMFLGDSDDKNVLINDYQCVSSAWNLKVPQYKRKWKGPYMDSEPQDFMYDSWGNRILYKAEGQHVYLWSHGIDGVPDCTTQTDNVMASLALQTAEDTASNCDDVIMIVTRMRKKFQ